MGLLLDSLNLKLTSDEFQAEMAEMDADGTGQVAFDEFRDWWYLKKYGRPRWPKAPQLFVEEVAQRLRSSAFSPGDMLIRRSQYANK